MLFLLLLNDAAACSYAELEHKPNGEFQSLLQAQ